MLPSNNKFRITAWVAEIIKLAGLPAPTAKLLFALIYLQEQTDEAWPSDLVGNNNPQHHFIPQDHFVFVAQLRDLGFPAKTNCSRFLRKPVAELLDHSGIFEHLKIAKTGRYLTWRFADDFFDAMADMDVYALIDESEIALCRGKLGGALLAQIPLHRRKNRPEFRLIGPNKGYDGPSGYIPRKLSPSQLERQLRPALQIWANATGTTFRVLLVQEGTLPGYTDVLVRMRHSDTDWPEGRFDKRPATAKTWQVFPETSAVAEDSQHNPSRASPLP